MDVLKTLITLIHDDFSTFCDSSSTVELLILMRSERTYTDIEDIKYQTFIILNIIINLRYSVHGAGSPFEVAFICLN